MKKIMYPSAALLTAFALLSVQTAKADTAQTPDQVNETGSNSRRGCGFSNSRNLH